MRIEVSSIAAKSILTRSSGYLRTVCSHSLQPYVGCTFGRSLCGVGCYVQHNPFLTRGARWGSFLLVKRNAASLYARQFEAERRWARAARGRFSVFMSSSTDPFLPHERKLGISAAVLEEMQRLPPDTLTLQTHTHLVEESLAALASLATLCDLRVHISIETDRERIEGLPAPASSVAKRMRAARRLREAGIVVAITVAPLLPIEAPEAFFSRLAASCDYVVIDHFIGGDGSVGGTRTRKTELPRAMRRLDPDSVTLAYRDRMVALASRIMPGRVGVGIDGFAGRLTGAAAPARRSS